jgi:hypothetical protein
MASTKVAGMQSIPEADWISRATFSGISHQKGNVLKPAQSFSKEVLYGNDH